MAYEAHQRRHNPDRRYVQRSTSAIGRLVEPVAGDANGTDHALIKRCAEHS
ncbi:MULTISPECIES: hypothetical protein [Sinorhizobium/Ensifer group]|uniref:hypothetical protein n=1 Tax=Sinorhizobium/Ensifer group TaxID=227292 RepID=UPI00072422B2|nr:MULTISPECIES: hypothetical protein [Sinorhizobium/Ensifer group]KSV88490.1 hypothetical protein N184_29470 [Sinorhizobium sp. GL28]MBD9506990.1 hypothetical protein [Ensifer sp. ENS10]MBV7517222.1 hypothetical protein [Ensifer sp. ENS12]